MHAFQGLRNWIPLLALATFLSPFCCTLLILVGPGLSLVVPGSIRTLFVLVWFVATA